jgi:hypothetical protein
MEELIEQGRRWPLSNGVLVDREAMLNILDQMRISVPREIRRSQELETEREQYVARAQQDARAILEQAREYVARLLDEQEIKRQAEKDARRILERARREARETRVGADAYAAQVLGELDRHVQQVARTIRNGLRALHGLREEGEAENQAEATPAQEVGQEGTAPVEGQATLLSQGEPDPSPNGQDADA